MDGVNKMTSANIQEARNFLSLEVKRAQARGEVVETTGKTYERALRTAARSIASLEKAVQLAESS
jgi:hypothetical protein